MAQLQEQILALLPTGIKTFIEGSSRRDLLRKVDTTLLVFDNQIAHIESGKTAVFQDAADQNSNGTPNAEHLALACKSLLGDASAKASILLLLPPSLFVTTSQNLPGVNKENLVAALMLQADNLLPANGNPVSLAINPRAAEFTSTPVALWISNSTMVEMFEAFEQQDLFIAAIKPRVLSIGEAGHLLDTDANTLTFAGMQQGIVMNWLQTTHVDLQQAEFAQQWQEATRSEQASENIELNNIDDYIDVTERACNQEYAFFPQGALSRRKQVEKGRKLAIAACVLAGLVFLSSIPFVAQSIQFRSLAATLESQRGLSVEARQDQAVVVNFENELGPINDFPQQRLREAMFTLQNVLSPNQLSSLEITEGLIKIQGTSAEPQAILQRLEMDPMFTEVVFSRATNNDRYYIDLRLSAVNFDAYLVRYFPDR